MSFIYVASPYTHESPQVREDRYLQVGYYFIHLLSKKKFPYSPIVANHHIAKEFGLKHKAVDWMAYNFAMLSSASELHILMLDGWNESVGVLAEINFWRAARQGERIEYVAFSPEKAKAKLRAIKCVPALRGG